MNKIEVKKLTSLIKGYYNNLFFVDDYVLDAWFDTMQKYDLEDAIEHLQDYLKEYPDIPPKPHTFKKGLYTQEEKEQMRNAKYTVECNLCHRWMPYNEYELHYDKCLNIEYLVNIAKQKGENITRQELENCKDAVLNRLYEKYKPKETEYKPQKI